MACWKKFINGGVNRKISDQWSIFHCLITGGYHDLPTKMRDFPWQTLIVPDGFTKNMVRSCPSGNLLMKKIGPPNVPQAYEQVNGDKCYA